eukprot:2311200-Pyramimonas_sp.AAC.1
MRGFQSASLCAGLAFHFWALFGRRHPPLALAMRWRKWHVARATLFAFRLSRGGSGGAGGAG